MAELVTDCPRCGSARTTFDLLSETIVEVHYNWQQWYEAFCVCRHCGHSTVFVLADNIIEHARFINERNGLHNIKDNVNHLVTVKSCVSQKDASAADVPEHLPDNVTAAFREGSTCIAVGCYNAAATMFRLCIDVATRPLLPEADENGLNRKIRRDLGLRLPWLFDNGRLPEALRELSTAVKEDGNDGAHAGTLTMEDAEDLLDFATALFERMYTEPERLRLARERREKRRE